MSNYNSIEGNVLFPTIDGYDMHHGRSVLWSMEISLCWTGSWNLQKIE